jgi:anti-sigma-K factor RskA
LAASRLDTVEGMPWFMTERQDIDMLAGEYVLGTLDATERTDVELRRRQESDLDAAIVSWESRLDPLNASTAAVEPPERLFNRIETLLDRSASGAAAGGGAAVGIDRALFVSLQRRVNRWRLSAAAAAALAACLAVVLLVRETTVPPQATNFVAIFNENDSRPAFVLTIDLASREVAIRRIAAQRQPGKTYQLWIVAKSLGPTPQSLGLLSASQEPTRKRLVGFEPALLQNATFGISLEPEGGSPTGQPTGPALHGKLIPAAP